MTLKAGRPLDQVTSVIVDGLEQEEKVIRLVDDRAEHSAEVNIG